MKPTIKLLSFVLTIIFLNACTTPEVKQDIKQAVSECPVDKIPASEGASMISEAKTYINAVNNSLDSNAIKIPYGAKIPICEMKEILNKLGDTPETWAMMAMEDGELTIIFQGKDKATDSYVYYDFTKPCPDKCPE